MAANLSEAPVFSRRVYNAEELLQAIIEATRAAGVGSLNIDFNGVVRLERDEHRAFDPFVLTIIKRH
jgi:hypothetical protein